MSVAQNRVQPDGTARRQSRHGTSVATHRSADARLHLGDAAIVVMTGLCNPCTQLERIRPDLMKATLERDTDRNLIRKAGIMGIVPTGEEIRTANPLDIAPPRQSHWALASV